MNFTPEEKSELKRLLYVAIMHEANTMNRQSVVNAITLIDKIDSDEILQDTGNDSSDKPIRDSKG